MINSAWIPGPIAIFLPNGAGLSRDKSQFAEHWTKDLDAWFKEGIETPGLVIVKVHAERLHYWDGFSEGEIELERDLEPAR